MSKQSVISWRIEYNLWRTNKTCLSMKSNWTFKQFSSRSSATFNCGRLSYNVRNDRDAIFNLLVKQHLRMAVIWNAPKMNMEQCVPSHAPALTKTEYLNSTAAGIDKRYYQLMPIREWLNNGISHHVLDIQTVSSMLKHGDLMTAQTAPSCLHPPLTYFTISDYSERFHINGIQTKRHTHRHHYTWAIFSNVLIFFKKITKWAHQMQTHVMRIQ